MAPPRGTTEYELLRDDFKIIVGDGIVLEELIQLGAVVDEFQCNESIFMILANAVGEAFRRFIDAGVGISSDHGRGIGNER